MEGSGLNGFSLIEVTGEELSSASFTTGKRSSPVACKRNSKNLAGNSLFSKPGKSVINFYTFKKKKSSI